MLSLLDKYLSDNPRQYTHCMSSDNECIALLKYVIHLNIDLTTFPTVGAVLSILLDTQDSNLEYVKLLQEEYNRFYERKLRKYVVNLEKKSIEIQNCMHDSVTHDFDSISDCNDNGLTPLQGQQDEQSEAVNNAENAIEHDAVDISTGYPSWSTDTNDICDNNEVICNRNRKKYKTNYLKTHQSKLKTISPI